MGSLLQKLSQAQNLMLCFLSTRIRLEIAAGLDMSKVIGFFDTHFWTEELGEGDSREDVRVEVVRGDTTSDVDFTAAESVWVRHSVAEFFSIPALRVRNADGDAIRCTKTGTTMRCSSDGRSVRVGIVQDEVPMLDLIELIRDLVLKNEERSGKVALHSTSVFDGERAFLIVGRKGAGKSTIALDLVRELGLSFMSGDKTFIWREDDQIVASGWPDWPHLGLGTLAKWPALCAVSGAQERVQRADQDALWSTKNKLALDPWSFRTLIPSPPPRTIAPVAGFIYPAIGAAMHPRVAAVEGQRERLVPNIEHAFRREGDDWRRAARPARPVEEALADLGALLERLPGHALEGSGDLSREAAAQMGLA